MTGERLSDERVAELTRQRLAALGAEFGLSAGREPAAGITPANGGSSEPPPPEGPVAGRHARRPVPAGERLIGWVADRLPEPLRGHLGGRAGGGRAAWGRGTLAVLVVLVGVALAVTAWSVTRAAGTVEAPEPVAGLGPVGQGAVGTSPSPALSASPSASGSAGSTSAGSTSAGSTSAGSTSAGTGEAMLVVDVAGRVRRPGIAVLPVGSRVVDALEAAGGARPGVDLTTVNLARLLVDGEQILVGRVAGATAGATTSGSSSGTGAATTSLVNLNTADQTALESLPGVGPVTAAAILAWREENGGFAAVEQLLEVSGIGEATLAEIAPHVTL